MSRWEQNRSSGSPGLDLEPDLLTEPTAFAFASAFSSTRPRPRQPPPSLHDRHATSPSDPTSFFYTHPARTSVLDGDGGLDNHTASLLSRAAAQPAGTMQEPSATETTAPWRSASNLPSFSRAFDLFTASDGDESLDQESSDRFFIPSYLESSTYMKKLEEAHHARLQAKKESKRSGKGNQTSNGTGFASNSLPSGSHRGMSHTVIERPAAFTDKDALAPLPTRWNRDEMSGDLELHTDGLGVKFPESKLHQDRELESCGIRADNYMPPQCGIYYYEVQILAGRRDEFVYRILTIGYTS